MDVRTTVIIAGLLALVPSVAAAGPAAGTGPASTGPASSGPASSGPAGTGPAGTGPATASSIAAARQPAATPAPGAVLLHVRQGRVLVLPYGLPAPIAGDAWWSDAGQLEPVLGGTVAVQIKGWQTDWRTAATVTTDGNGRWRAALVPEPGRWSIRAVLQPAGGRAGSTVSGGALSIQPAPVQAGVGASAGAVSEAPFSLTVSLTSATAPAAALSGQTLTVQQRGVAAGSQWVTIRSVPADTAGHAVTRVAIWKSTELRAVFAGSTWLRPATGAAITVSTTPSGAVVATPSGAPEPKVRFPQRAAPKGTGAAATVSSVPDDVWASMQGKSWHSGCTPRWALRLVEVNHRGFDGYRYRGRLIVRNDVAGLVAAAFTDMYNAGYPIRQMILPDAFGRQWNHVGANDLDSMAADNTSAFNCRYVDGKEAQKVLSPHASGRALDVDTWENPYRSVAGDVPDSWYMAHRPASNPAVLFSSSAATVALTSRGWSWGGTWVHETDYQHFERGSASAGLAWLPV